MSVLPDFQSLSPDFILDALYHNYGIDAEAALRPFNSYVNRVYGLTDTQGNRWIVKFYRPGRWLPQALAEEHTFLADAGEAGLPLALPLANLKGETLSYEAPYFWAVFPQKAGRTFEGESLSDLERIGSLVGRLHSAAKRRSCPHRLTLTASGAGDQLAQELWEADLLPHRLKEPFFTMLDEALNTIEPLLDNTVHHRIHGDLHRGNILDRPDEGLLLIDFDDMMTGPPVQDLWMLLPDRWENCREEAQALARGYEVWMPFDNRWWNLLEPLRFLRMLYFLAWCARQRKDEGFSRQFPGWGTPDFWQKEWEDLNEQYSRLHLL